MKKTVFFAFLLFAGMAFSACSDDDDEGGSSSSSNEGVAVITTDDGDKVLLTSILCNNGYTDYTDHKFEYDSVGRCTYAYNGYVEGYISWDSFSIVEDYGDDDYCVSTATFTSEGYFKKVTETFEVGNEKGTETWDFSYDSSGHLTEITSSDSGYDYGTTNSWNDSAIYTQTWNNGRLVSAYYKTTWDDNYSKGVREKNITFTSGTTENKYGQYTVEVAWYIGVSEETPLDPLVLIGMLGKGPDYLVEGISIESTYTDEDKEDGEVYENEESYSRDISYTLNSNGTIESETCRSRTYTYTYTTLGSNSSATKAAYDSAADSTTAEKRHGLRRLSWRARHQTAE